MLQVRNSFGYKVNLIHSQLRKKKISLTRENGLLDVGWEAEKSLNNVAWITTDQSQTVEVVVVGDCDIEEHWKETLY